MMTDTEHTGTCGDCGMSRVDTGVWFCKDGSSNYARDQEAPSTEQPPRLILRTMPACEHFRARRRARKVDASERISWSPEMRKALAGLPKMPPREPFYAEGGRWFCFVHGEYEGWLADWEEFYNEHKDCHRAALS
jgi:hypothetical protein